MFIIVNFFFFFFSCFRICSQEQPDSSYKLEPGVAHYGRAPQVALDAAQRLVTEAEERRPGIESLFIQTNYFQTNTITQ